MAKEKFPTTPAIRELKKHRAEFSLHPYKYVEKGGTAAAAEALSMDEHSVIKTLVMESRGYQPFLVLMHGDKSVSTKALARILGVKTVSPCEPKTALQCTGYLVGGISPFGTRKPMKVYMEATVMDLPKICINAGKRGLLAIIPPGEIARILNPEPVNAAI